MKNFFTVKRMCRAGVIAALYVATTYAFGAIGYEGLFEIRPAEALTILPLFFPEAVPALWIGCMLANLASPFFFYDVILGALATLISALGTYAVGRLIRKEYAKNTFRKLVLNEYVKVGLGGLFPILINAFAIPAVIILAGGAEGFSSTAIAYWTFFVSLLITEILWVYGLGIPLYFTIYRLREKGVFVFSDTPQAKITHVEEATELES